MRVAVVSVHGCPLMPPGVKESGGMNVYVRELSRHLGRMGVKVDVFARWHDPEEPQTVSLGKNVRVVHLEAGGRGELGKDDIYQYLDEFLCNLESFRNLHQLKYDLIHSHYWLSGWVAAILKRRWRVPHVAMFHTLGEVKNRAMVGGHESPIRIRTERTVAARADCIIAPSPQEKSQVVRLYSASPSKVEVIPCGVDMKLFRPMDKEASRHKLGLSSKKTILFVGRIDPIKGIDTLLESIPNLSDVGGIQVVVVGAAPEGNGEYSHLEELIRELGIGDAVQLVGAVERNLLPYYYNSADVCVIPSYYESFGMVAVESLACGTPVVASRVGGLQSTVRDWETGYLVPWRCPEAFAERLDIILGNEDVRRSMSQAARASVETFQWPVVARDVLRLYEALLESTDKRAALSIG
ncbi:MAG: glycosyltransferase family 1 protein [Dehalococcoidia bacterium]|nr:glycosyltransferase family 1 protein [Dehalococcoidia bacterium]